MKTSFRAGLLVLLVALISPLAAQRIGETVTIDERLTTDQYIAGRIIRVNAPIEGDLVVAGQRLIIGAEIGGDLIAAAESLTVRSAVADDVRAAGRTVNIGAPIAGHIVAAGEDVVLDEGSAVEAWAWLAGRTVAVGGRVGQALRAAGQTVSVTGQIAGDANLIGERIQIGPTARIGGDLILQSRTAPEIAEGATITGEIIREDLPAGPGRRWIGSLAGSIFLGAALATAVLAVALVFPGFSRATSERIAATPLRAIGLGLVAAIGMPVLIVLLFTTGIGLILGLGTLGIYLLLLLLGGLVGIIAVGSFGLGLATKAREHRLLIRSLAMLVATIVVLLLVQIPVLGGILSLLLMLAGLGAVSGELWRRYRRAA